MDVHFTLYAKTFPASKIFSPFTISRQIPDAFKNAGHKKQNSGANRQFLSTLIKRLVQEVLVF